MYNGTSIVIITQYPQCCQMVVDLLSHVNTWWEPKSLSPLPLLRNSVDFDKRKTKQNNKITRQKLIIILAWIQHFL